MRKFINLGRYVLFVSFGSVLLAASCNNSPNSNVGVLTYNSPTPTPMAIAETIVKPSPQPSPAPVESPAPTPEISPTPETQEIDPFVKSSEAGGEINNQVNNQTNGATNAEPPVITSAGKLMIPVVGVQRGDLRDTFDAARSEGRVHDAIDIMAAGGTPIVAATNGKIVKFLDSVRGGITIYQFSPDERTVYYYAHLQRRADNLREGETVEQGTLLGYVGDTGNSGTDNYHLHFAIWTITDPKHFYDGTNINPYPLLKEGIVKPQ